MTKDSGGMWAPLAKAMRAIKDEPRVLMLIPALFWAGNAIVARGMAGDTPPIALAFWRWVTAAVLSFPFAWPHVRRDFPTLLRHWPTMVLLSVLGISIFNTFLYLSAQSTMALNIVILQTTMPVMVVIGSYLIFRETVGPRQIAGVAASLAGALTLISRGDPAVLRHLEFGKGDLWMLAAVLSYAVYTVLLRLRPPVHALSFAFASFVIGGTILMPFYLAETALVGPMPLTVPSVLAVGYVGLFASILAYLAFNRVVEIAGANTAGLTVYLVPVFGTILAVTLLGERFLAYHAAGIALIALGLWLATLRPAARA